MNLVIYCAGSKIIPIKPETGGNMYKECLYGERKRFSPLLTSSCPFPDTFPSTFCLSGICWVFIQTLHVVSSPSFDVTYSYKMFCWSKTTRIHWVVRGTGTPKGRDEVNKREVYECDGWVCDLEVISIRLMILLQENEKRREPGKKCDTRNMMHSNPIKLSI